MKINSWNQPQNSCCIKWNGKSFRHSRQLLAKNILIKCKRFTRKTAFLL